MESNYLSWSLILIALVLSSASLASSEWSLGAGGKYKMGLWRECVKSSSGSDFMCFNTRDANTPSNITGGVTLSSATQKKILFLRSAASAVVVLLLIALFSDVFMSKHENMRKVGLISLVLAVALSVVVMIVWATDKSLGKLAAVQSLALGWYLQLAAAVFAVVAFVLVLRGDDYVF